MFDEQGRSLSNDLIMERVKGQGAVVVRRGSVDRTDVGEWRRQLRTIASVAGMRVHVRKADDSTYIVSNPDHQVTDEQLRAAIASIGGL